MSVGGAFEVGVEEYRNFEPTQEALFTLDLLDAHALLGVN